MKKKVIVPALLLASGLTFAACGNSAPAHSKSFNAGVAWVRDDFPNTNVSDCFSSPLIQGTSCTVISQTNGTTADVCASNGAVMAISLGNYNMQQWIDGCLSVPLKHWPRWLLRYLGGPYSSYA